MTEISLLTHNCKWKPSLGHLVSHSALSWSSRGEQQEGVAENWQELFYFWRETFCLHFYFAVLFVLWHWLMSALSSYFAAAALGFSSTSSNVFHNLFLHLFSCLTFTSFVYMSLTGWLVFCLTNLSKRSRILIVPAVVDLMHISCRGKQFRLSFHPLQHSWSSL